MASLDGPAKLTSCGAVRRWQRPMVVAALLAIGVAGGLLFKRLYHAGAAPVLKVSTRHLDLGEGKPGERMEGRFAIANAGRQMLQFSIAQSCGCTSLEPRGGTIAVGSSQEIDVAVSLPASSGTQRSVQLAIQSNDPTNPTLVCVVTASCPSPLTVSPGFVTFGNLTTEEVSRAQQVITVRDRDNRPLADPTAIEFECGSEHVLVDRDPSSGHEVRLRVHLAPTLPRGDTNAMLSIRPTGYDVACEMPIQVTHLEPIVVAPPVIIPGTGRAEEEHEVHTLFVWGNGSNTDLGRLLSIEAPEGILVTENDDAGSRRRRLKVAVARTSDAFPGGQIRLAFEHLKEALIVNVASSRP